MIRTATPADLPRITEIQLASWRDAFQAAVPGEVMAHFDHSRTLALRQQNFAASPAHFYVALTDANQIAGFAAAGPAHDAVRNAPFGFEIYALHVDPAQRQRGVGASLLHAALADARARRLPMIVWTLQNLPLAQRFYQREGGLVVKHAVWQVAGHALAELAYGWDAPGF